MSFRSNFGSNNTTTGTITNGTVDFSGQVSTPTTALDLLNNGWTQGDDISALQDAATQYGTTNMLELSDYLNNANTISSEPTPFYTPSPIEDSSQGGVEDVYQPTIVGPEAAITPVVSSTGTSISEADPIPETDSDTVTIPSMVDNQADINASIPGYFNDLMGGVANYNTAYDNLAALPEQIDEWTAEALKRQRVTGDQATSAFNDIANQRAGSGIMGGTEGQNLNANALANLTQLVLDNQNSIQSDANNLKAGTIQGLPATALAPVSQALGLYGTTASEAATWGQLAMNTLLASY